MTAALAKEEGIPVRFQNVYVDETWSRSGSLYFSVGHVNLTLGGRPPAIGSRIDDGEQLIVDFLPPGDLGTLNWRVVEEKTIVAMYMNNRAAESLTAGRIDDAYWYAREAIGQDPAFLASYNTLGVVYQRSGRLPEASRVLAYVLDREPRNTIAISNLATVLAGLGRTQESGALERRLAQLEPEPPFAYFNRGLEAMRAQDYRAARDLFAKEVERAPYYHEFHFWLALALARLGDVEQARQHLNLAMENSTTRREHDLYAAKLDRIRSASSRLH
jgi:tetratricopeptide (TPR) repeat protein